MVKDVKKNVVLVNEQIWHLSREAETVKTNRVEILKTIKMNQMEILKLKNTFEIKSYVGRAKMAA